MNLNDFDRFDVLVVFKFLSFSHFFRVFKPVSNIIKFRAVRYFHKEIHGASRGLFSCRFGARILK